jgi:hypothetical protein
MSKIKKVLITEFGNEDKLAIVEDDIPEPEAREVQLAVEYSIVSGSREHASRHISLPEEGTSHAGL